MLDPGGIQRFGSSSAGSGPIRAGHGQSGPDPGTGDRAAGEIVEARGETTHQDAAYPGQHPATVDAELGQIVQDKLSAHRRERFLSAGAAASLLAGLIVDADGERMTPTHAAKHSKRYRHYFSASLLADEL